MIALRPFLAAARVYANGAVGEGAMGAGNGDGHFAYGSEYVGAAVGGTYAIARLIDLGAELSWTHLLPEHSGSDDPGIHAIAPRASIGLVSSREAALAVALTVKLGGFFALQTLRGWRPEARGTYPLPEKYTALYAGLSAAIALEFRGRITPRVEIVPALEVSGGTGSGRVRSATFEPYLGDYLSEQLGMVTLGVSLGAAYRF